MILKQFSIRDMSSTLKDDLEDILSCSICLERLTEPKLLPCSHRFCKPCLRREMDRSATPGPAPYFPCPLCKRTVYLPRGRRGKERIDCFETDRLLKDVLERLDGVTEGPSDVCRLHRKEMEIVCHGCQETGCLRCAWDKHRHCTKVEVFRKVVEKVELDLRHLHQKIGNRIQAIKSHHRKLTSVKKSFENQIRYSNKFADLFIQDKRDRFKSDYEHLVESYSRKTVPSNLMKDISELMQTFLEKLTIDSKYEQEVLRLKKNNLVLSENVSKISLQIESIPGTQQLTTATHDIDRTLELDKSEMVLVGGKLLAELEEKWCEEMHSDDIAELSGHVLDGLITREEQIHLDIKEEETLLATLKEIMDRADDPRKLLDDLEKHVFPHKQSMDPTSSTRIVSANFSYTPTPGKRDLCGMETQLRRTYSPSETGVGSTSLPINMNSLKRIRDKGKSISKGSVKDICTKISVFIFLVILVAYYVSTYDPANGLAFIYLGFFLFIWIYVMIAGALILIEQLKPKKKKKRKST